MKSNAEIILRALQKGMDIRYNVGKFDHILCLADNILYAKMYNYYDESDISYVQFDITLSDFFKWSKSIPTNEIITICANLALNSSNKKQNK